MARKPRFDPKSRISKAWISTRPEMIFTAFDQYFATLAGELMKDVDEFSLEIFDTADLDRNEFLAVIVASYFEDFISEIGLWKAFTDHCREELGCDLPFYDLEGYDSEYINWQDIAILIWAWVADGFTGSLLHPHSPTLIALAKAWVELLEDKIDDAPAFSYFDKFLEVKDANDFFRVRDVLNWLTLNSWLFGQLDMRNDYDYNMERLLEGREDLSPSALEFLYYDAHQNLSTNGATRFGGVLITEMAKRIIRGNQDLQDALSGMGRRFTGDFEVLEIKKSHYVFLHLESGLTMRVVKESIDLDPSEGKYVFTSLVQWRGEYWVCGGLVTIPTEEVSKKANARLPYNLATAKDREIIRSQTAGQETVFKQCFGKSLVVRTGRKAIEEAMSLYYKSLELYNAKMLGREPRLNDLPKVSYDQAGESEKVAIFFSPGVGVEFNPFAASVIDYLQGAQIEDVSSPVQLLVSMALKCDLPLVKYIQENYDMTRLEATVPSLNLERDLTAFCWFHNPNGSVKSAPSLSLLNA